MSNVNERVKKIVVEHLGVDAAKVTVVPETVPGLPMVCHAEDTELKNARNTEPAGAVENVKLTAAKPVTLVVEEAVRAT